MPKTLDTLVLLCAVTGLIMIVGSLLLLYRGVIKLSEKVSGSQIEAEFKDQLKVNVRNPALGLFVIGFAFFALALYFGNVEVQPIEFRGVITGAEADHLKVRVRVDEWPVRVSSDGKILETVRPSLEEKLSVEILAPGYQPARWTVNIEPSDARRGRIVVKPPAFSKVIERPAPDPANIKPVEVPLPGLEERGRF